MQVNIAVRHGVLSAEAHERVTEKVAGLPKYFDRVTAVYVTVDMERETAPHVEIRATAEHAEDFVAHCEGPSVGAALDGVLDKLRTQLSRHKDKLRAHQATSHKRLADDSEEAEEVAENE